MKKISVPTHPIVVILRGAALCGLSMKNSESNLVDKVDSFKFVINERILKYTYGIKVSPEWQKGIQSKKESSMGQ